MIRKKIDYSKLRIAIIGSLIGAIFFIGVYGFRTLNVCDDSWILQGYDELDILDRYDAWMCYRNSEFIYPLAQAKTLAYPAPTGANITFMDGIPIIAFLFKCLSSFLPTTFQYEGIYALFIFIMQGLSSALLLKLFIKKDIWVVICIPLFLLTPIFLERTFRHSTLATHFFILLSMYFYFKFKRDNIIPWGMGLLTFISVGVTPYFLPMIMLYVVMICINEFNVYKRYIKALIFLVLNVLSGITSGYIWGSIGNGYESSRNGYGFYSMNLNSLYNPRSLGNYKWSLFLNQREQLFGQYDGFNYLGVGVYIFIIIDICIIFYLLCSKKIGFSNIVALLKRNYFIVIMCIILTIYAISNIVCFDNIEILTIKLPQIIIKLCGIFRASSRLFYPVTYMLIFSCIICLLRGIQRIGINSGNKQTFYFSIVLVIVVSIQLLDISGALYEKNYRLRKDNELDMNCPEELLNLNSYRVLFSSENGYGDNRFELWLAGKNNLFTNAIATNTQSIDFAKTYEYTSDVTKRVDMGDISFDTVYVTVDRDQFELWKSIYKDKATFYEWNHPDKYTYYWPGDMLFMLPDLEKIQ